MPRPMQHLRHITLRRAQTDDAEERFRELFLFRLVVALVAFLKSDFPI